MSLNSYTLTPSTHSSETFHNRNTDYDFGLPVLSVCPSPLPTLYPLPTFFTLGRPRVLLPDFGYSEGQRRLDRPHPQDVFDPGKQCPDCCSGPGPRPDQRPNTVILLGRLFAVIYSRYFTSNEVKDGGFNGGLEKTPGGIGLSRKTLYNKSDRFD